MQNWFLLSLVAALLVTSSLAQECPRVGVQQDFDPARLAGVWYEIQRDPSPFQPSGDCSISSYGYSPETGKLRIENKMILKGIGKVSAMVGEGRMAEPAARDGRMIVKFPIAPIEANVWVAATDYDNYAVLHSCNNVFGMVIKMSFVMSRTPGMSPETRADVEEALARANIDTREFEETTQGGSCKY